MKPITDRKKKIDSYMRAVKASIKKEYGSIPPEFQAQLIQLEDIYKTYLKASDLFDKVENPISMINGGKTPMVNIQFTLMRDCITLMDKLIKNFGLSPLAQKRLKGTNPDNGGDTADYMDTI